MGIRIGHPQPWERGIVDQCRNWPATNQPASFRGIRFAVESETLTGGRRVVTHEYPNREFWDNEDLGRQKVIADVSAFVYGAHSDIWEQRLFAACQAVEPTPFGQLVLPTRGFIGQARCILCSSEFVGGEQGRYNFQMRFVLEQPPSEVNRNFAGSLTQMSGQVDSNATRLVASSVSSFSEFAARPRHTDAYSAASTVITRIANRFRAVVEQGPLTNLGAARLTSLHNMMRDNSVSIANSLRPDVTPTHNLASILVEGFRLIRSHTPTAQRMVMSNVLTHRLSRFGRIEDQFSDSFSSDRENMMERFIAFLTRRIAVANIASLSALEIEMDRPTLMSIQSRVQELFDIETAMTGETEIRSRISSLSAAWSNYRAVALGDNGRRITIGDPGPLPLIITWAYGDAWEAKQELDRELMEINKIMHPLFVTASEMEIFG